ncbi:hypothetical protein [Coleofasciculus sp. F4-SAH-05]|uniref:hypothetical protein n=1 Tax=Coleofasciculus sp. F4-SAH-05 TaxID=3069525 RepID=UPI0032F60EF6
MLAFLGNLVFLFDEPNLEAQKYFSEQFNSGFFSIFRKTLKPLQAFIKSSTMFFWLLIPIFAIKQYNQVIKISILYVISASIQAVLSLVQFIVYLVTGFNLFPINRTGLIGENIVTQDAIFNLEQTRIIRVNALAGEPKHLALFLCFGLAINVFLLVKYFSLAQKQNIFWITFSCIVQFAALLLTFSTFGYITFMIGLFLYIFWVFIDFTAIGLSLISIFIILFLLLSYDHNYLVGNLANSLIGKIFELRFLERLNFDDFDQVYLAFIKSNPSYLLVGTGFGNFHLASFNQASEILSWRFGIILPKLGIFNILATSGVSGLLVYLFLIFRLLRQLDSVLNSKIINNQYFYYSVKNLIVYMIISGFFLRLTNLGLLWIGVGFAVIELHHKALRNTLFKINN